MNMNKTALIIGATGVTGKPLMRYLTDSEVYSTVVVFTRRAIDYEHAKLINHVVDFDALTDWKNLLKGDDLFSALGTTLKLAGSKEAQYKVDYHYQADVALAASENGVSRLFLVSSPNAKASSPIFYTRMKGKLEDYVATLQFDCVVYFRPSFIEGDRTDNRPGEKVGLTIMHKAVKLLPFLGKYRPISGDELAHAIASSAQQSFENGLHAYELDDIFSLI